MNSATLTHPPDRHQLLSRRTGGLLVALWVILLVALRAAGEWAMMSEFGSDPQMAIWMGIMVASLLGWLLGGGLAAGWVILAWNRRWGFMIGFILLFGWSVGISRASWEFRQARLALAEARDPATSPARLHQLAQFSGIQAGYELGNRLAANPQTPPETLRQLYSRHQLGTLMILARNGNTPEDVLQAMVDHDLHDPWVRKSLEQNRHLPEAVRQKLEEQTQPLIK